MTLHWSKIPTLVTILVVLTCFSFLAFSQKVQYRAGSAFFGGFPTLYNVSVAQFFFSRASNPILGNVPPYTYHQLSRTYFIQGELGRALELAHKEIELYPEHIHTYYIIGLTLGYMGKEEEAIEAFGKFIEYKPESWAARNDRAWLQFQAGDISGALATIEPVAGYTENPWVQNTYGILLLNRGEYVEAWYALGNAKRMADAMTEESWGSAYPGNDPRIYPLGLKAMRKSIDDNLALVRKLVYEQIPLASEDD